MKHTTFVLLLALALIGVFTYGAERYQGDNPNLTRHIVSPAHATLTPQPQERENQSAQAQPAADDHAGQVKICGFVNGVKNPPAPVCKWVTAPATATAIPVWPYP